MSVVTIRSADNMLLLDGRPFFAIQCRHLPTGGTWSAMSRTGFNCLRHRLFGAGDDRNGQTSGGQATLPSSDELAGLKVCVYLWNRMALSGDDDRHAEELSAAVRQLKDHPNLVSWETYNEPAWRPDAPTSVSVSPEELRTGYQLLRSIDPDHPVHLGHSASATVEALQTYNVGCDIVGCNPYPVLPDGIRAHIGLRPSDGRALDSPDQTIGALTDYTNKMVEVGEGEMPCWMQIQAMAWEDFRAPGEERDDTKVLFPSHHEMRFMAFAAVVNGATGLLFSMSGVSVDNDAIWPSIEKLVGELSGLADVLAGVRSLQDERSIETAYVNLGFSIWKGVQIAVKLLPDGRRYMIAVNAATSPARPVWSGLPAGVTALRPMDAGARDIPVDQRSASDDFGAFEVHVYLLVCDIVRSRM